MNAELIQKALEKVGSPNTLVNIISRRVRQLNSGGGSLSRPLVTVTQDMGVADTALLEIIEGKIGWELPVLEATPTPASRRRKNAGRISKPTPPRRVSESEQVAA